MFKPSDMIINEQSFTQVYEQFWHELYLAGKRYTDDEEVAKGLVQDIFIGIWENRDRLVIHTSIQHYLHRALKLKAIEYYRKQAVIKKHISYQEQQQHTQYNNTERSLSFKEVMGALNNAVDVLPDRCREVYLMRREVGLDNRSIAAQLVISEKAVEANMTRALSAIRNKLKIFRS